MKYFVKHRKRENILLNLGTLSADTASKLDILWHNSDTLGVNGAQIGVLEQSHQISLTGLYLWGFLTPPVDGADFLAALVASCFLGAFPPVDLRAVCLVRAIVPYVCVS